MEHENTTRIKENHNEMSIELIVNTLLDFTDSINYIAARLDNDEKAYKDILFLERHVDHILDKYDSIAWDIRSERRACKNGRDTNTPGLE